MPLSIQAGMTAAIFVYFGWVLKKYEFFKRSAPPVLVGTSAVIWLFGVLFCREFYIVRNHFGSGLFAYDHIFISHASFYGRKWIFCEKL